MFIFSIHNWYIWIAHWKKYIISWKRPMLIILWDKILQWNCSSLKRVDETHVWEHFSCVTPENATVGATIDLIIKSPWYTGVTLCWRCWCYWIPYMSIELSMKSRKWNIIYIYKHPKVLAITFCDFMHSLCETFVADDKLCIFMGDMNCNMLVKNELTYICDIYGLNNLIKDPTCFKSYNDTAVDVILTNKSRCFSDTFNIDMGLSDFHNCIGVA